jgi:hypothetical protein
MSPFPRKRAIAIGAAVLAVAGGGGAAVAASTSSSSPNDFLDSVAKHLGISRQKLDDATKAAAIDQVDAQLAAGKITKEQADALKKRIESGDIPPLGGLRGPGPGFRLGGAGGPGDPGGPGGLLKAGIGDSLTAAAKYLGLSESDLRTQLQDGKSLADVAKAQSKDLDGLEQAILAAAKSDLDKAVSDKQLTQSQADDVYNRLKSNIDDMVNGQLRLHFRGPGGPGGPHIFGTSFGDDLTAAAKYLGLTESALRTQLQDGKSLADVAKAQSKDVNGLEQAILAAQKADLDKAVSDKKLTQSQADDIYNGLKSHIDDLVNSKPGAGPRLRGGRRGWFGP